MIFNEAELKRLIREAVQEAIGERGIEPNTYLSVQQASEKLGISRTFCDRLIREEGLPVVRMGGSSLRIKSSSLEKWMSDQEESSKWRTLK